MKNGRTSVDPASSLLESDGFELVSRLTKTKERGMNWFSPRLSTNREATELRLVNPASRLV